MKTFKITKDEYPRQITCPVCGAPGKVDEYRSGTINGSPVYRETVDYICGYAVDGLGTVTSPCPDQEYSI